MYEKISYYRNGKCHRMVYPDITGMTSEDDNKQTIVERIKKVFNRGE